jgi:hypothetical protein
VPGLKKEHYYKGGYPITALVGFDKKKATVCRIFSMADKPFKTIEFNENDRKSLYSLHESIVDALRPIINEGVRAIVLASPVKTGYRSEFLNHVKKHYSWLIRGDGSTFICEQPS